ncbi:UDP-glucose--hexose-1-phosphate uridylyltransferase [Psychrilyobacter atlanticus]|uniref:UDP-glucose--hexose-1-phosphate uridylyltransferase n=1 Tax=Psychrilyobacter atlanticus TaxID=271091 RepID=UPI00048ABAB0|nr:UDP-glucose--hexose-1-phosphate uridylyltransferase [Psychrilyobacter atlanticus]
MDINYEIERLLQYGIQKKLLDKMDLIYIRNSILEVLEIEEFKGVEVRNETLDDPVEILENIMDWADKNNRLTENTVTYRDLLDARLMGCLMPRPSEVVKEFYENSEKKGIKYATENYYAMSKASNYIRTERTAKNMHWYSPTEYGDLEITVNLSKPEKDPKAIAAAKHIKNSTYPSCVLCKENEGYRGRVNHPARQNHRIIPLDLSGEEWFLQYSPYVYYNEHSIVFSSEHRPMKISKITFMRLLEFVEKFPHYFIGSNADLPIVGGSILSHDHFQGGNHEFAMAKAPIEKKIKFQKYPNVEGGIVKWPMSVVRLSSENSSDLAELADEILCTWRNYSDEEVGIFAETGGEPHNTVTPIVRRRGKIFELDMVLRNNRTSDEHPLGIFHPHEEVHNIKKENIGLIEVMGLAVLPGRLKEELAILEEVLLKDNYIEEIENNKTIEKHLNWAKEIKENYDNLTSDSVKKVLHEEVGVAFSKVLEDAGVYKRDEEGQDAFMKFIKIFC